MKKLFICIAFAFSNLILFAQKTSVPVSFVLQGKFTNYPGKVFYLQTFDDNRNSFFDTIQVNADGNFYFKNIRNFKPQRARIGCQIFDSDIFIAPGYNLTLTCDTKEFTGASFILNKKITGVGGESNRFISVRDSLLNSEKETTDWTQVNEKELMVFLKERKHLNDSLYHSVFDHNPGNDKYFGFFKQLTSWDNSFENICYVLVRSQDTTYSSAKMKSFVSDNTDKKILNDLFNEKYLISKEYRNVMGEYAYYLRALECKDAPANCKGKNYNVLLLTEIAKHYTGKIKQIALLQFMTRNLGYCRSFAELNTYKKEFPQFVTMLENKSDQQKIDTLFANMEKTLLRTQVGNPAPAFVAEDSAGRKYNIENYKGKVVYLDLWASWCGPCRHETPYLKKLVEKFDKDSSIAFISVAVLDKKEEWKKALADDTPQWLQLFDTNGTVHNAYVAYSIPKFILINKEGKIVSFDAPVPSSGEEIEKLLRVEIAK